MGKFNKFGGKKDFGGKRDFRDGGRPAFRRHDGQGAGPRLFDATCANCGKETQVPFRPTGDRPVYCRECFAKVNAGHGPREERRDDRRERGASFSEFPQRFAPQPKPQAQAPAAPDKRIDEIQAQIKILSSKIDKLIGLAQADIPSLAQALVQEEEKIEATKTPAKEEKAPAKKAAKKEAKKPAAKKKPAKKK